MIRKTIIELIKRLSKKDSQINDMGKIENGLQDSILTQSPVAKVSLKEMLKKVIKKQTNYLSEHQV